MVHELRGFSILFAAWFWQIAGLTTSKCISQDVNTHSLTPEPAHLAAYTLYFSVLGTGTWGVFDIM